MLHLDAINNLGTGDNNHSTTTTTWKDLSGNGNDGLLNNFKGTDESGWQKDNIIFDGIDNWIGVNEMNYENITIEALVNYAAVGSSEISAIGNWESGGYGMVVNSIVSSSERNKNSFCININGTYKFGQAQDNVQLNKKYSIAGTYDGNIVKFWENNKKTESNVVGTIKYPNNNTIIALGTNPKAENAKGSFLNGKIYSIRVYNRALTEEEVLNNYKIDKARFNIED